MEALDPQLLDVIHDLYAAALDPALAPVALRKLSGVAGLEPLMADPQARHRGGARGNGPAAAAAPPAEADWSHHLDHFCALGSFAARADLGAPRPGRDNTSAPRGLQALRILMPHLKTAAALHRRMRHLHGLNHSAFAALERMQFGLVLLGAAGEWRHANSRAEEIGARTQAFSRGSTGRVQALAPALTAKVHAAIHAASSSHASGTALRLRCASGAEVHAFLAPLPRAAHPLEAGVAALMFVSDPDAQMPRFAQNIRRIYRLSPSEAQLAEALVNGKSLKGFAEERGTTLNTVKTQLKSLAGKVGAKRQVDVVRCILTGPAVLHL